MSALATLRETLDLLDGEHEVRDLARRRGWPDEENYARALGLLEAQARFALDEVDAEVAS